MLPSPVMTILHVVDLELGHHLGIDHRIPIGAAILTAELRGRAVDFTLGSRILRPTDKAETLLAWLSRHVVREGATITGYRLNDAIRSLASLPGGDEAPALRAMTSCHRQYLLDLSASESGKGAPFYQACEATGIACSAAKPAEAFHAWVRCDVAGIEAHAQVNVIAAFRLLLVRLASINDVGRHIATALDGHLREWLDEIDHPAGKALVADLMPTAN